MYPDVRIYPSEILTKYLLTYALNEGEVSCRYCSESLAYPMFLIGIKSFFSQIMFSVYD